MLPRRIPKEPKRTGRIRCPAHRAWVRSHHCCVPDCSDMPIECAHIRLGSHAGMGEKPDDDKCISLCAAHHRESHNVGEDTFAKRYRINLQDLAAEFAKLSPHRLKLLKESSHV